MSDPEGAGIELRGRKQDTEMNVAPLNRRLLLVALATSPIAAGRATAQQGKAAVDALMTMPIDDIVRGIESGDPNFMHPATQLVLAERLFFKENRKDDAVFWFYAGQLRFRIHLTARPSIDRAGDPALFAEMMDKLNRPINQHAFGDIDAVLDTYDRVLDWDAKHRDRFTPPEYYAEARDKERAGLAGLKADVLRRREEIKADRAKAGLPNK